MIGASPRPRSPVGHGGALAGQADPDRRPGRRATTSPHRTPGLGAVRREAPSTVPAPSSCNSSPRDSRCLTASRQFPRRRHVFDGLVLAIKQDRSFAIKLGFFPADAVESAASSRLMVCSDGSTSRAGVVRDFERLSIVRGFAALPLQAFVNPVPDNAARPGAEFVRLAQKPEVSKHNERFLRHILALAEMADAAVGQRTNQYLITPTMRLKTSRSARPGAWTSSASLYSAAAMVSFVIILLKMSLQRAKEVTTVRWFRDSQRSTASRPPAAGVSGLREDAEEAEVVSGFDCYVCSVCFGQASSGSVTAAAGAETAPSDRFERGRDLRFVVVVRGGSVKLSAHERVRRRSRHPGIYSPSQAVERRSPARRRTFSGNSTLRSARRSLKPSANSTSSVTFPEQPVRQPGSWTQQGAASGRPRRRLRPERRLQRPDDSRSP